MNSIMGLDLALANTGIVVMKKKSGKVIYEDKFVSKLVKGRYGDMKRAMDICDHILGFVQEYEIHTVFIEGYSFGSRGHKLAQIHEVGGLVKSELYKCKVPYVIITPGRLKQFVTGKGNSKKDLMIKAVYKKWDFDTDDPDIADAYGLAKLGRCYLNNKYCEYSYEKKLIKQLKKENKNGKDKNK